MLEAGKIHSPPPCKPNRIARLLGHWRNWLAWWVFKYIYIYIYIYYCRGNPLPRHHVSQGDPRDCSAQVSLKSWLAWWEVLGILDIYITGKTHFLATI